MTNKFLSITFTMFVGWPFTSMAGDAAHEVAELINGERQQHILTKLVYNDKLAAAAQSQATWMACTGKMAHWRGEEPTNFEEWQQLDYHPVNRMIRAGYFEQDRYSLKQDNEKQVLVAKPGSNSLMGEIIAYRSAQAVPEREQAALVVSDWRESPSHHKIILTEQYADIGVGIARNQGGDTYWCTVFGKR